MKEKIMKALLIALGTGIGVTLVSVIDGEGFSITKFILCVAVMFIVDILFSLLFNKKKKMK